MDFIKNKKYRITFEVNGATLNYDVVIIEDDGVGIRFTDRFNKEFYFKKDTIKRVDITQ